MAHQLFRTLIECLEVFRPALTSPGFDNMVVIFTGWVLTMGTHAVTQALVVTSVAGRQHHEAFHRFFSRGTWDVDELGRLLFMRLLCFLPPQAPIRVALDDTLAPKKGAHVFGMGPHLDAVRSSKLHRVFSFGHCWVVVAVLLPVPFSRRLWALPILFRLYRNKTECEKKGGAYRKKTELAREMLEVFASWTYYRRIEVAADVAYCNDTVTRELPPAIVLIGAMRSDAVLTSIPPAHEYRPKGGRPRKRGQVLPKPEKLARDDQHPWQTCQADLYGRSQSVRYKECLAQWYQACGTRLLRVVVVSVAKGSIGTRVFFATDPSMNPRQILESYAGRWSIEVCFRNLKQLLGFADSSARKQEAVERTAPFVGFIYSLLVLWFVQHAYKTTFAKPPVRPWYRHKRGLSFLDVLRTARRILAGQDVLNSSRPLDNLSNPSTKKRCALHRRRRVGSRPVARPAP